jgi:ribosome recycling factor
MDVNNFGEKLKEAESWLQKEFTGIRSGQASPQLLDSVRVMSYGSLVPMNQVGNVSVEDARTLRVNVWDAGGVNAVEQAIRDAELGVSVASDSSGIRVFFPELTSERREQLLKLAKSKLEDARITVRSQRDEIMKHLDKEQKEGNISEDEKFSQKEKVQSFVAKTNKQLESLFQLKESELQK